MVHNNTHRAACAACSATVILAPGTPTGTATPAARLDAIATIARGTAILALPVLPATIAWECPACDTRHVS